MNYNKVYTCLWIFLHAAADVFYFICSIGDALKLFCNKMYNVNLSEESNEKQTIQSSVEHLTKIPENVVVILGEKIPEIAALTKFISWVTLVGVKTITFYDYQGKRISNLCLFYEVHTNQKSCDSVDNNFKNCYA